MAQVPEENVHNALHEQHAAFIHLHINVRIISVLPFVFQWFWEGVQIDACTDETLYPVNVSFYTCPTCLF